MARKKAPSKPVTFRLPLTHYEVLHAVAVEKGIDVTAMLNQIVTDALPGLQQWLIERQREFVGTLGSKIVTAVKIASRAIASLPPSKRLPDDPTVMVTVRGLAEAADLKPLESAIELIRDMSIALANTMSPPDEGKPS